MALISLGSPPASADYRLVFDFNGEGHPATLPLNPGPGTILGGRFRGRDAAPMAGFARARRVTATVYEGDRQVIQSTFELTPERREAGLAAFARSVQANDPRLCHPSSGPPLPVPPVLHHLGREPGS
jgi:hypothetical protein